MNSNHQNSTLLGDHKIKLLSRKKIILSLIACTAVFWLMYFLSDALTPFIISGIIAYLLLPILNAMESRKINRSLASLIIVLILSGLISVLIFVALPILMIKIADYINITVLSQQFIQLSQSISQSIIKKFPYLESYITPIFTASITNIAQQVIGFTSSFTESIVLSGAKVINFMSIILLTPMITFYILRDAIVIKNRIINIVPISYQEHWSRTLSNIHLGLSAYLYGQMKVCFFLSFFYAILLYIVNLRMGILIGIIIGIISFIPYIGFIIGLLIAVITSIIQFSSINHVMIVIIVLITGQIIEGNFVTPKVMGSAMSVHPNWIVFGLFTSIIVCGSVGAVISLPLTAIFAVIVREILHIYYNSNYYKGSD